MKHAVTALGIQPQRAPSAGELQVVARRPDGSVEPLIWVKNFNPGYKGTYYFRDPLRLAVGTQVKIIPSTGEVTLLLAAPRELSSKK